MKTFTYALKSILVFFFLILLSVACKQEEQKSTPPAKVTVVKVLQKDVELFQEFVGQTYGAFDIPIRARVQGFLEGIHFNEGTRVHKGQHLYSIDPQSYLADVAAQKSNVAQSRTLLVKAKNDLDRYEPLAKQNAVSQSDLDNARAQYEAALSEVEAAKANLKLSQIELGYTEIYSPIDGIIGKTNAKVGEFVGQDPNPVILNTVSDISKIHVEFFLTESDYLTFAREFMEKGEKSNKRVKKAGGYLELILADGSTFKHKGEIKFIDREINPSTGSLLVQAVFDNPENLLRPGQYAKVLAHSRTVPNALLIPQACVTELQGQYSVFIIGDSNKVQNVQITTGPKEDDYWMVKEGLKPTDLVILDGIQKVSGDQVVDPQEIQYKSKAAKQ
ncbi:MAG: efflux transporter periplasmic adaptor subunit [Bacteroidetes bacterium 4572_77]|nr:MAG: efflux transporter periplasmic adaptor subunit [Bacteroidetes bacterium 4572_77]